MLFIVTHWWSQLLFSKSNRLSTTRFWEEKRRKFLEEIRFDDVCLFVIKYHSGEALGGHVELLLGHKAGQALVREKVKGEFDDMTFDHGRQFLVQFKVCAGSLGFDVLAVPHLVIRVAPENLAIDAGVGGGLFGNGVPGLLGERINKLLLSELKVFLPKSNSEFLSRLRHDDRFPIHLAINKILPPGDHCHF
jgi:hypothetical protein